MSWSSRCSGFSRLITYFEVQFVVVGGFDCSLVGVHQDFRVILPDAGDVLRIDITGPPDRVTRAEFTEHV